MDEKCHIWKRKSFPAILLLVLVLLTACTQKGGSTRRENTSEEETQSQTITAVITGMDEEKGQITVRELEHDTETILSYDARTQVTDRYGTEGTASELEVGQIMELQYTTAEARVLSANVPKDAWEYQKVEKFGFDLSENAMTLAGKKFQYDSQTFFASGQTSIDNIDLNKQDVLVVRGMGIKVYSVVRVQGHGYIRLKNYSEFVGGMISVGNQVILPIAKNMLITVREGTYRVTLAKKSLAATKTVTVKEGEETILDFSDYTTKVKNVGKIIFHIEPEGADLYINNTAVDYSSPIALNYGTYVIRVEMTGYTTYTGTLKVGEPQTPLNIELPPQDRVSASASPSAAAKATGTTDGDTGDADAPKTVKMDSKHKIKVTAPEGAEVYLDDVYKGIAPCSFTKIIGSQTITLSKSGYVTKSYSIDVLDDDKNVTLSFAELAEDSD